MTHLSLTELPAPPAGKAGWPWTVEDTRSPAPAHEALAWPLVSIVTPSYNAGAFIEETIRSVLLQDYPAIEYIVMDGGSTDGTLDILRKYGGRLSWSSEKDAGQSDAINKGWRQARGEVIAYLNADDLYHPGALRTAVQFFVDHPQVAMVYSDGANIAEGGEPIGIYTAGPLDMARLVMGNYIPQETGFLRKAVLDSVGYLDPTLHYAMDYDLWLRVALKFRMEWLPVTLGSFRWHEASKSVAQGARFYDDIIRVLERFFSAPDLPEAVKALEARACGNQYLRAALTFYTIGQPESAKRYLAEGIARYPGFFEPGEEQFGIFQTFMCHDASVQNWNWWKAPRDEKEQEAWLRAVFSQLPDAARRLTPLRGRLLAQAKLAVVYRSYAAGDLPATRVRALGALVAVPGLVRDRGLVSVLLESLVGRRAMQAWRDRRRERDATTERRP